MTAEEILEKKSGEAYEFSHDCVVIPVDYVKEYTRLKCKELLEIVAEKALIEEVYQSLDGNIKSRLSYAFGGEYTEYNVNTDSILNAIDLKEFIK